MVRIALVCLAVLASGCMNRKPLAMRVALPEKEDMAYALSFSGKSVESCENIYLIGRRERKPILMQVDCSPEVESIHITLQSIISERVEVLHCRILCGGQYVGPGEWEKMTPETVPELVYDGSEFRLEFFTYDFLDKYQSWVVQGEWADRGMFDGKPIKVILIDSIERKQGSQKGPIMPDTIDTSLEEFEERLRMQIRGNRGINSSY